MFERFSAHLGDAVRGSTLTSRLGGLVVTMLGLLLDWRGVQAFQDRETTLGAVLVLLGFLVASLGMVIVVQTALSAEEVERLPGALRRFAQHVD